MSDALAHLQSGQFVPAGYAEKAMASLMQLHSELMDEKERRVDLFRKLMEREQALAELRMYVKLLEEKVATHAPKAEAAPGEEAPPPSPPPPPQRVHASAHVRVVPPLRAPVPPQINARVRPEGWKVW